MRFVESPPYIERKEFKSFGGYLFYNGIGRLFVCAFAIASNVAKSASRRSELKSLDELLVTASKGRNLK